MLLFASNVLESLGWLGCNLAVLNVMVFFCNSQGKMNLRNAEEKQGKVIQIGR